MYHLVVTEKPSVAQSIAAVIGAAQRRGGYLEGNGYLVSWCIGHLVELADPSAYGNFEKWRKEDLPILPDKWQYQISSRTKKQFEVLRSLMLRPDVDRLICATDAGREGELIFRLTYQQSGCSKPFDRLWISSMEDSAIREGFQNLKSSAQYDSLYHAALCRERADWIIGINATRLFSCLYGQPLTIGRVMTPTLGMTVQREAAIAAFVPEPFYTVQLCVNGMELGSKRFSDRDSAASLLESCKKEEYVLIQSIEQKERTEKAPALYDLTTLQRDANRILGFTAQQTLDYTQSLYEKKLVTYPRTDSRYLTEDAAPVLAQLVPAVTALFHVSGEVVLHTEQVINNQKVSDHHAIIPTITVANVNLETLPKGEQEILRLISIRLLAAVGEPYRFVETTVTAECAGEVFTSKGKVVVSEGWKGIVNQFFPEKASPEKTISNTETNAVVPVTSAEIKEGKTTPPKHFTEDLLLQAMETACADEFPEDAERKGIGTPATRAATIEKLVQKGYLERKGKGKMRHLIPTQIGQALITVAPEQIQSPSMTADWEEKLSQIEHGQYTLEQFMGEIAHMITDLVNTYEIVEGAEALMRRNQNIGICPHCGSEVVAREKGWMCRNRECRFVLWKNSAYFKKIGKPMTEHMAARLIREKRLRLKDCQSQRTGRVFTADVLMSIEPDGSPTFTMTFPNGGAKR